MTNHPVAINNRSERKRRQPNELKRKHKWASLPEPEKNLIDVLELNPRNFRFVLALHVTLKHLHKLLAGHAWETFHFAFTATVTSASVVNAKEMFLGIALLLHQYRSKLTLRIA